MSAESIVRSSVDVGEARVAYRETGVSGLALLLLHGCPFGSFVWNDVLCRLGDRFRCVAPDLLGLGDTETPGDADWSLPAQAAMVVGFLDALGIDIAHVIGHDHGGAVAQLLTVIAPARLDRLVLSNAEAYDNWPSAEERPFIRATQLPVLGRALLWVFGRPRVFRMVLCRAHAVYDPGRLSAGFVRNMAAANFGNHRRRARTSRFLAGQLTPGSNQVTIDAAEGLRRFDHPTMLLWALNDEHFGPEWAERLRGDLAGPVRVEYLDETGHLLMEERPDHYARLVADFLTDLPGSGTTSVDAG